MVGYKMTRGVGGPWAFCGTTPEAVANVLKMELEEESEPAEFRDQIILTPFEITQEEIDKMPEFPGW